LTNLLGKGSFGSVYQAEHIYLGIQAAVKVMNTEIPEPIEDTFRTEARALARLIHPYIVRILDFGMDGPTPFLVLDYAPNGTLRDRYPRLTRLPVSLIASYVKQIAEALAFAHERQLVHRDIKPENILLGRHEEALVSDFGIAIMIDPFYTNPSAQQVAGTLTYIAPEQLRGFPQRASDQYSLGVVVYEWLTGTPPFQGKTFAELANQHLNIPPPPLSEKAPNLSPAIEQVVLKALEKDPQQRYPTITEFAQALEQAIPFDSTLSSAPTIRDPFPLGFGLGTIQVSTTLQKTKEEWLAIGNDSYDHHEFEEALLAYQRALAIDPHYAFAWIGRGIALRNLKRYEESLQAQERAIQLSPDNAAAYNNLSLVLNDLKRYRESLVFSQRALELNANYPAAYLNMGYVLLTQPPTTQKESHLTPSNAMRRRCMLSRRPLSLIHSSSLLIVTELIP
jgi:serine/threonine protein kinase